MPDDQTQGQQTDTETQTPPQTGDATGQATGQQNGGDSGKEEPKFTQADLDRLIKDRLERERAAAAAKAQKDKEAAEAEKLKEQAEWKTLAEQHEGRVKELEPQIEAIKAERDALAEIVTARVAAEIKDWPAEVKALIPDDGGLLVRLAAVEKARPIAAKLIEAPKVPGNGYDPRPLGGAGGHQKDEDTRRAVRSQVARQF